MAAPRLRLSVIASPAELDDATLTGSNVVVIDVLRATTVIAHALAAGAAEVVPAGSVESALKMRGRSGPDAPLLCGERGGFRVPGFDLGNSPLEYLPEVVRGRTVILASTNGSVLLARCRTAGRVLAASFNTLSAVASRMRKDAGEWSILCSGKLGRPCLEDLACAGRLAGVLGVDLAGILAESPSDSAGDGLPIALAVDRFFDTDAAAVLRASAHGRYLESIGFGDDLEICGMIDSLAIAPELIDGRIVAAGD